MGFLDGLLGRRKPVRPNLDSLFAVPAAAITLEVSLDLVSTGRGAVAFRSVEGRAFADVERDVRALLEAGGDRRVEIVDDSLGYTWVVVNVDPPDVSTLVTDLHAINVSLVENGFGPQLLCSLIPFRDPDGSVLTLIYLFKRGTFYPFAPVATAAQERDSVAELRVRDEIRRELPVEGDLTRWFPVWGAPGLD